MRQASFFIRKNVGLSMIMMLNNMLKFTVNELQTKMQGEVTGLDVKLECQQSRSTKLVFKYVKKNLIFNVSLLNFLCLMWLPTTCLPDHISHPNVSLPSYSYLFFIGIIWHNSHHVNGIKCCDRSQACHSQNKYPPFHADICLC